MDGRAAELSRKPLVILYVHNNVISYNKKLKYRNAEHENYKREIHIKQDRILELKELRKKHLNLQNLHH